MKSDLCAYLKINISPIFPNSNMNLITWATTLAQAPFCTAGGCAGLGTHDINILYSCRMCILNEIGLSPLSFMQFPLYKIWRRNHRYKHFFVIYNQEIRTKGRKMALVWHEKASRTALQTSLLLYTHTLLVQTHTWLRSRKLQNNVVNFN